MQIVSRRANEGIMIGREIRITVLEIGKNEDWVDIEITSTDDGDSRVMRLSLPREVRESLENAEEYELVPA